MYLHAAADNTRFAYAEQPLDHTALVQATVPQNSKKKAYWAVSVFDEWLCNRPNMVPTSYSEDILHVAGDKETFAKLLAAFLRQTRRVDGRKYPLDMAYFPLFRNI